MLLLALPAARAAIYAFDFGAQNVRVALGVPGKPIEIRPNDEGARSTPNFLAYSSADSDLCGAEW